MWNVVGKVALAVLPAVLIWYFDRHYRRETMESLKQLSEAAEKINGNKTIKKIDYKET